ncbi:hypothetical protein EK904_011907 [Melospiza melodia maxima]|nr:hypothetical protein EK904_011907 [Melospiza melodia maxima]
MIFTVLLFKVVLVDREALKRMSPEEQVPCRNQRQRLEKRYLESIELALAAGSEMLWECQDLGGSAVW